MRKAEAFGEILPEAVRQAGDDDMAVAG